MPTPKNGFQIFNLHPKKHIFKKNTPFFLCSYFCLSNTNFFDQIMPQLFQEIWPIMHSGWEVQNTVVFAW